MTEVKNDSPTRFSNYRKTDNDDTFTLNVTYTLKDGSLGREVRYNSDRLGMILGVTKKTAVDMALKIALKDPEVLKHLYFEQELNKLDEEEMQMAAEIERKREDVIAQRNSLHETLTTST